MATPTKQTSLQEVIMYSDIKITEEPVEFKEVEVEGTVESRRVECKSQEVFLISNIEIKEGGSRLVFSSTEEQMVSSESCPNSHQSWRDLWSGTI
jgi:hypothetical protein